jgi:hypothetical protein
LQDQGAIIIAVALMSNSTLKNLSSIYYSDIANNNIKKEGISKIADVLKVNTTLKSLGHLLIRFK